MLIRHQYKRWGIFFVLCLIAIVAIARQNEEGNQPDRTIWQYSDEHPLVFEDAWDLWPYAFLDEHGNAQGYNIDLLRLVMAELDIPYRVELVPRQKALADMKRGQAQLTLGMVSKYHEAYGSYGKCIVHLFTHSVLTPMKYPVTIHRLQDLSRQKVIVHERSFSHQLMVDSGWGANAIPYVDMKAAVQEVSINGDGEILWNTASLKWLLKMCHIENLQLTPVSMPYGEYRFISRDTQLLDKIDEVYDKLRSKGRLDDIQAKWFHPEQRKSDVPRWIWSLGGLVGIVALFMLFYYVNYRIREHEMRERTRQDTNRLALILEAFHVRIWLFDVEANTFTWMGHDGLPQHTYNAYEFAHRYHHDDFERLYKAITQIADKEKTTVTLEMTARDAEEEDDGERRYRIVLTALRCDENGKPTVIIGTKSDITEEIEKQRQAKEQLMKNTLMFNTSMIDMAYYDENGNLVDMNERGQHTLKMSLTEARKMRLNVRDIVADPDFDLNTLDRYYTTLLLKLPISSLAGGDASVPQETIFYEHQLVALRDKNNKLLGIYGTGRNVSEAVDTYRQIQGSIKSVQRAYDDVADYVNNINYVLGVGGVRMAKYSPDTHMLTIFKGHDVVQLTLTQSRCMRFVDDKSEKTALRMLNSMDSRRAHIEEQEIKTTLRRHDIPLYLQFRFIPTYDEHGRVQSYFGLCRDTSEINNTNVLLAKETERAQEVENLKNAFLRNMSYEIRTPLNAVVGFAELFEQDHSTDDEPIFIREIKDNSAHLLNLINDILFLSRLDAHMITIESAPIDFAQTFEAHCHMGWSNYQKEGVTYKVENTFNQLVIDIDDTNTGRIIEQVTANAAQYTKKGTVSTRYDYTGDKLLIVVTDTGCGMPKDMLDHVFERFATANSTGTGLGLPICRELAKQLGGDISISSEQGKGTTVWISLPCTATVIDRKYGN